MTTESTEGMAEDFPGLEGSALALARLTPPSAGKSFSESWKAHFALTIEAAESPALIGPSVESILGISVNRPRGEWLFPGENPGDLLEDSYYSSDVFEPGVIYAAIHTRQGGGNRDCYCDDSSDGNHESGCLALNNELLTEHEGYLFDFDDSFDSTYATFVFKTKLTSKDVEELEELRKHIANIHSEKSLIDQFNAGTLAPWIILGTGVPQSISTDLASARRALSSAEYSFKPEVLEFAGSLISVGERLIAGEAVPEDEIAERFGALTSNDVQRKIQNRDWHTIQILDRIRSAAKSAGTLVHMRGMVEEAEELPADSKLAKYLLGDRGQGSYNTTEKRGRRNVTVRKVYDRGSKLGEKLKSADRVANDDLKRLQEPLKGIREIITAQLEAKAKIEDIKLQITELEKLSWAAGWPGEPEDLPVRPTGSVEDEDDDSVWGI